MVDEYYDSAYADYPLKALTKNTELTTEVQQKVMYEIDSLLEGVFRIDARRYQGRVEERPRNRDRGSGGS